MLGHSSTIITTNVYYDKSCMVIDMSDILNEYIDVVKPQSKNKSVVDIATNFDKVFKRLHLV